MKREEKGKMKRLFEAKISASIRPRIASNLEILLAEITMLTSPERERAFVEGVLALEEAERLAA